MRGYRGQPIGTVPRARQLRRDAGEPERRLLRALREAFPHLKWRHQVPIGPFYADILCFSKRLVIEVDGDTHARAAVYDTQRTEMIASKGYRVIRVANTDVMQNLDGVLTLLSFSLREKQVARRVGGGKAEGTTNGKSGTA